MIKNIINNYLSVTNKCGQHPHKLRTLMTHQRCAFILGVTMLSFRLSTASASCAGLRRLFLISLSLALIEPNTLAAQASQGEITGRVSNEATGAVLQGAEVELLGEGRTVLTSRDGRFRLQRVPIGTASLRVTYLGVSAQTIDVLVREGEETAVEIRMSSPYFALDGITAVGEREGIAAALQSQRSSVNLRDIVSTDQFGNIADSNIGNFVQRLAGVSTVITEGVVYQVGVRGAPPNFTALTVDGTRPAAGGTRNTGNRVSEVDKIPADMIERVELIRAATPDMDSDAIGGTVNLVRRKAFDRVRRTFRYSLGAGHNLRFGQRTPPSGSFFFSDTVDEDGNLGILITGSLSEFYGQRSGATTSYSHQSNGPSLGRMNAVYEDDFGHIRGGAGVNVDWRASERTSLSLSTDYSYYEDDWNRRGNNFIGVSNVRAEAGPQTTLAEGRLRFMKNNRWRTTHTGSVRMAAEHELGDWKLDADGSFSYSRGTEGRRNTRRDLQGDPFTFVTDRGVDPVHPRYQIVSPFDPMAHDQFNLWLGRGEAEATDRVSGFQLNAERSVTSVDLTLRSGVRFRGQQRALDRGWAYFDHVGSMSETIPQILDPDWSTAPVGGRYTAFPHQSNPRVEGHYFSNSGAWAERVTDGIRASRVSDFEISENVTAAYLMGVWRTGSLTTTGGIRVEGTRVEGEGLAEIEDAQSPLERYSGTATGDAAYSNVFPSLHLRYELREGLILRGSWSTGIGRPNYTNIVPSLAVSEENRTVRQNNPALRPQYANNIDLFGEYYFEPLGRVSVGLFRRDLQDFIFTDTRIIGSGADNGFEGRYEGFELRTSENGGEALIQGLEVHYQQQFAFLPGWLSGFGAFGNYTWLKTEGNYTSAGTLAGEVGEVRSEIAGFKPRLANLGISYEGFGLATQIKYNHQGTHLLSWNADQSRRQYFEARNTVDLHIQYQVRRGIQLFTDVTNLTDDPRRYFVGNSNQVSRNETFGTTVRFGVSGSF